MTKKNTTALSYLYRLDFISFLKRLQIALQLPRWAWQQIITIFHKLTKNLQKT